MARAMPVDELRKMWGIKNLRKKKHILDAEKQAILSLREKDRQRVERAIEQSKKIPYAC